MYIFYDMVKPLYDTNMHDVVNRQKKNNERK